jgi:hypothetical protein
MIEQFHFWSTAKLKFATKIVITILVIAFLLFVVYALVLYHQKVKDSTMESNYQPQGTPPLASVGATNADSTNAANSSLAPMSDPANPN